MAETLACLINYAQPAQHKPVRYYTLVIYF